MSESPIRKDKVQARQGKSGLGVIYTVIAGTVLVIVAFALVWLLH